MVVFVVVRGVCGVGVCAEAAVDDRIFAGYFDFGCVRLHRICADFSVAAALLLAAALACCFSWRCLDGHVPCGAVDGWMHVFRVVFVEHFLAQDELVLYLLCEEAFKCETLRCDQARENDRADYGNAGHGIER